MLGNIVNQVVVKVDGIGFLRAVSAIHVNPKTIPIANVVDVVVRNVVGAIAIDVDAMAFLGDALDFVDLVAVPDRIVAIAGDAGHARDVGTSSGCGRCYEIIVYDAPVVAENLLAYRAVATFAVNAQVGDNHALAHASK